MVRLTPDQGLLGIYMNLGLDEVLMVTIGTTQKWIPAGSLNGWLHLLIRIGDVFMIMTMLTVPQGGTGIGIGLLTHRGLETYPGQCITIGMWEVHIGLLFLGLLFLLVHLGGISRSPVHLGLLQLELPEQLRLPRLILIVLPGERSRIRDLLELFLQLQFLQLLDLIGAFILPLLLILMFLP